MKRLLFTVLAVLVWSLKGWGASPHLHLLKASYISSQVSYPLKRYQISPQKERYRLELDFGEGLKISYDFQYQGDRIIFFTPKGKRILRLPEKRWHFKRVPGSHRIVPQAPPRELELPAPGGKVSLLLRAAR